MPLAMIEQTNLIKTSRHAYHGSICGEGSYIVANERPHSWQKSERVKGKLIQVQRTRRNKINRYLRGYFGVGLFVSLLGPFKRSLSANELTFMVSNRLFKVLSICASTVEELFCFSSLAALSSKLSCTAPAVEQ